MRYEKPKCPECGETLAGECDLTPGRAEVYELDDEPGTFEYTGNTEMFWDGQQNELDIELAIIARHHGRQPPTNSKVRVECENGHQWETEVDHS